MKKLMLGAAVLVSATAAWASDPMAARFGNTVTITDSKGAVMKLMYKQGGAMDVKLPDGTAGTGTWVVKDGKLCVTSNVGPTANKEQCNALTEHKVGDTWDVTLADGSKAKAALVAGTN
ncbi:MAG TPA: hypothetical protein DCL54_01585 [Alphaproteobacteria bacterium]|nr:hypothetical protein [Alphaproteobacteria bacterium]HAJ45258.1 hypothetical protein [Alphaproteobacteria bacterium]